MAKVDVTPENKAISKPIFTRQKSQPLKKAVMPQINVTPENKVMSQPTFNRQKRKRVSSIDLLEENECDEDPDNTYIFVLIYIFLCKVSRLNFDFFNSFTANMHLSPGKFKALVSTS